MNLELLDPFRNSFPEIIEETLEEGFATTCAFNRVGTLLATGCYDGRCIIWDFDTRSVSEVLAGHIHPITSLSWSKNGRKLLSSSTDWTVNLFDVLSGNIDIKIEFESAILSSQMHPKSSRFCIVCPHLDTPVLVELETGEKKVLPVEEDEDEKKGISSNDNNDGFSVNQTNNANKHGTVAVFNKIGNKIYCGNSKGIITIIETETMKILSSFKVASSSAIKSIHFSRSGKQFLVNSADRIIRVFEGEDSKTASREFQDPINKMQWKKCCFSCDSDFVLGGSALKSQHHIYIWNREEGQLIKTLEGPKEGIMDLMWHPLRPIIVSISTLGVVYIWASNYTENWSAFAPDFKELEENEEYHEKEDEFDILDEETGGLPSKRQKIENFDEDIDILTNDKIAYFSSDSDDDLLFIPLKIIPDQQIKI